MCDAFLSLCLEGGLVETSRMGASVPLAGCPNQRVNALNQRLEVDEVGSYQLLPPRGQEDAKFSPQFCELHLGEGWVLFFVVKDWGDEGGG
jgi:hypothetical protein